MQVLKNNLKKKICKVLKEIEINEGIKHINLSSDSKVLKLIMS